MEDAATNEAERNRVWYLENRKTLVRGKWYVIDGGALALGPFDSAHAMDMFFEHTDANPVGEHAYYVRAGNADPDSIDETFERCVKQISVLRQCGQHRKLMFLSSVMDEMIKEMNKHSFHEGGKQKDRDWEQPVANVDTCTEKKLELCRDAVEHMETVHRCLEASEDQFRSFFEGHDFITWNYHQAVLANSPLLREMTRIYAEAASLMRLVRARVPRDADFLC